MKARLVSTIELAPDVRHFNFEVASKETLQFVPGQFVSVVEELDGKEITRPYSIASKRDGNRFSLCLNCVAEGLVSPFLFALKPGQEVEIHEPLGYFTLRRPERHTVFVATGTGVAPFRSMLHDHLPETELSMTLLFGVRQERSLLYGAEFEDMERRYKHFHFLPSLSRPSEAWMGRRGRVQAHLDEALRVGGGEVGNTDIYICGMKEMVDQVRAELKQRGFDRKQIIYEKYD